MGTILFNDIVFGPIRSRRLGTSLGVNLLPRLGKWCNFDCLYCECGFNKDGKGDRTIPSSDQVIDALQEKLKKLANNKTSIDTITFSGNGEPTMNPDFAAIIRRTLVLRETYVPGTKVSVLTNGSNLGDEGTAEALMSVDNAIIKIDSAIEKTINLINRPSFPYSLERMVENLRPFRNRFVLQTMFLKGEFEGMAVDNTTKEETAEWLKLVERISPREIMMYTLDRETPAKNLTKVSTSEMEKIAAPLIEKGYKITISG